LNKSDVGENEKQMSFMKKNNINYKKISVLYNLGVENIILLLISQIQEIFPEKNFNTVLTSQRELEIVEGMLETVNSIDISGNIEIIAEVIRELLSELGEIYGYLAPDEIINKIFDSFCIGK
jgi:tRNA U34 5-carboxymethylaminomethyl modifying GTPase MnmE/TrmE